MVVVMMTVLMVMFMIMVVVVMMFFVMIIIVVLFIVMSFYFLNPCCISCNLIEIEHTRANKFIKIYISVVALYYLCLWLYSTQDSPYTSQFGRCNFGSLV